MTKAGLDYALQNMNKAQVIRYAKNLDVKIDSTGDVNSIRKQVYNELAPMLKM